VSVAIANDAVNGTCLRAPASDTKKHVPERSRSPEAVHTTPRPGFRPESCAPARPTDVPFLRPVALDKRAGGGQTHGRARPRIQFRHHFLLTPRPTSRIPSHSLVVVGRHPTRTQVSCHATQRAGPHNHSPGRSARTSPYISSSSSFSFPDKQ
jgi:hypothetical protein